MSERLRGEQAVIYKIFCNAAEGVMIDLTDPSIEHDYVEASDVLTAASDYVEDLYEEGVGEDVTEEQVEMLEYMAIADRAWFLVGVRAPLDGRNFND